MQVILCWSSASNREGLGFNIMDDSSEGYLKKIQDENSDAPFHVIIAQVRGPRCPNGTDSQSDTGDNNRTSEGELEYPMAFEPDGVERAEVTS